MTKPMPMSSAASGSSVGSALGREAADREVRDDEQPEHRGEEAPQVGREVGLVGELDEQVAERR